MSSWDMLTRAWRLAAFLYQRQTRGFDPPGDEPFMDPEGVVRFKQELGRASLYLEFGSGGTTVQADRHRVPTISVESDAVYSRAVSSRLSTGCVEQIVVDLGLTGPWGSPVFDTPSKAARYVSAPFGRSAFPDFILVDGRYRVACALECGRQAFKCGASATLMFDDYKDRSHYHPVQDILGPPEIVGRAALFTVGRTAISQNTVRPFLRDKR